MKIMLWVIGVPIGIFAALFLYFLAKEIANPQSPVDRIAQGCQREFGSYGQLRVLECRNQLMIKALSDIERQKLESAGRGGR